MGAGAITLALLCSPLHVLASNKLNVGDSVEFHDLKYIVSDLPGIINRNGETGTLIWWDESVKGWEVSIADSKKPGETFCVYPVSEKNLYKSGEVPTCKSGESAIFCKKGSLCILCERKANSSRRRLGDPEWLKKRRRLSNR